MSEVIIDKRRAHEDTLRGLIHEITKINVLRSLLQPVTSQDICLQPITVQGTYHVVQQCFSLQPEHDMINM